MLSWEVFHPPIQAPGKSSIYSKATLSYGKEMQTMQTNCDMDWRQHWGCLATGLRSSSVYGAGLYLQLSSSTCGIRPSQEQPFPFGKSYTTCSCATMIDHNQMCGHRVLSMLYPEMSLHTASSSWTLRYADSSWLYRRFNCPALSLSLLLHTVTASMAAEVLAASESLLAACVDKRWAAA